MQSHIAILRRPAWGVAIALAVLLSWIGQAALVAAHTHDEGRQTMSACHAGCAAQTHEEASPAEPPSPEAPRSPGDEQCQICMMASLASNTLSVPSVPVTVPYIDPEPVVIEPTAWSEPTRTTPGLHKSRGPPRAA